MNKGKLKRLTAILAGQGAVNVEAVVSSLRTAGMLPKDDANLTERHLATLLIGLTAPDASQAVAHIHQYSDIEGSRYVGGIPVKIGTLLENIEGIFAADPANLSVTSIRVAQGPVAAWIRNVHGDELEFLAEDFHGCGFRHETVISGGLISALSMKIHFDTESGWKE